MEWSRPGVQNAISPARRRYIRDITGLSFSARKFHKNLKTITCARVQFNGSLYTTSVIEYLSKEVLDLAGELAKACGRSRIELHDVRSILMADPEFTVLLKNVIIPVEL